MLLGFIGGTIKAIFVILLFMFLASSCNNNKKNNSRIIQLESNLKKSYLTINTLEKNIKRKEKKIQYIMEELSVCKQSKIKYINEKNDDYDIIDENNNDAIRNEGVATTVTNVAHNPIKNAENVVQDQAKKEINFVPPSDIIGECKKSDIRRVFHNLSPYFKKCFKNSNIKKGIIGYSWIINESGDVLKVNLVKNNIFNKNLSSCLMAIIKKGRYNSPKSGICTITYIFKL